MHNERLESDRAYVKKEVNKLIDGFFDDFKKVNNKLKDQEKLIKELDYTKTIFARAYAVKLGILLTRKQFEKMRNSQKKPNQN